MTKGFLVVVVIVGKSGCRGEVMLVGYKVTLPRGAEVVVAGDEYEKIELHNGEWGRLTSQSPSSSRL